jgi:glycosyltransferase involved in cell wall biosynthesis
MDKKIHVYSLTTSYTESLASNTQFVHVLNKELVNHGVKIKTITPHSKNLLTTERIDQVIVRRFRYLPERYEIGSIAISEVFKSKLGFVKISLLAGVFDIFTFFECLKERPDILHGHWAFPSGYIAFLMSKIFGKPFVVTIHGGEINMLKKFKFLQKIIIKGLNQSSQVIANSTFTKNEMITLGIDPKKITIIKVPPNFVEIETDTENIKTFRKKFTDSESKIILFVGRLVELKGVEYLIKSLIELKNTKAHLIVAGDGPLKKDLEKLTTTLDLEDKVTFFGRSDKQQLGLLHSISDVFVCPSIIDSQGATEGLGLVIPEAMKSGLPVIASAVGGIPDTVKNEENGLLVDPKNSLAIADAIERILSDKKLTERLIENSKETVQEFSIGTIGGKYYDIFKKISVN